MIKYDVMRCPTQSHLSSFDTTMDEENAGEDTETSRKSSTGCRTTHSSPASHSTRHTSLETYTHLLESGVLGDQERAYLHVLRTSPQGCTDREAARILGLPASTVSARRNGVAKRLGTHVIVNRDGERRKNTNGSTALVWRIRE